MHLLTVGLFLHIDKVDNDQATDVAQAQLEGNLFDCLEVGLENRVFEIVLADKAPGVDIDRRKSFCLLNNDVAAALQPDFPSERTGDLHLETKTVKNRLITFVLVDLEIVSRHKGVQKTADFVELDGAVNDDPRDVFCEDVAQNLAGDIEIRMDQAGCAFVFAVLTDFFPEVDQIVHVGLEFFTVSAFGHGADDEAGPLRAHDIDQVLQAIPFFLVLDAAGDADMVDRGHIDQVASRQ